MRISQFFHLCMAMIFCLFFMVPHAVSQPYRRDGKLLRGEIWQKFMVPREADFYVAVNGNDDWSGTLPEPNAAGTDGPFATLKRAQKAVRELKAKVYKPKDEPVETRWIGSPHPFGKGKDILVLIREGFYTLDEPLLFGPQDGGERVETNLPTGAFEYHKLRDHYVTWAAMPGEKVVIAGGRRIEGWKRKKKNWEANIDGFDVNMLVADSKKQVLARTPNEGYFIPPVISETTDVLHFNPGELKAWKDMENNRIFMLLRWHYGINTIIEVDEKKGIARLARPQEGIVIVSPRYYVENVPALMDAPGEWYYDKKAKKLGYILPEGMENPNNAVVEAPQLQQLIIVKGERGRPVRNLRIYNLSFEGTLPGNAAVSYSYAHANEFVGNRMSAMGGTGISLGAGCYQTRILDNRIEGVDNRAIMVKGPEKPASGKDILRETWISHNYISNCGGVNIDASFSLFTTISHNFITKTRGRYAISVGGWHNLEEAIDGGYLVEYNHLADVQKDADDSGAIKTAGTTFNSVVQKNLIHDVHAGFFNDNVAFWFDNMSLGWVSRDNIYYNLEQGEMKLCAANLVDNLYENNYIIAPPENAPETFIEGEPAFRYGALKVQMPGTDAQGRVPSGTNITVSTEVFNEGATGIAPVIFYLDGKIHEVRDAPAIHGNATIVSFDIRLYDAGEHEVAIGDTPYRRFIVYGDKPAVVYEKMAISERRILKGEQVRVTAVAKNLTDKRQDVQAMLLINDKQVENHAINLEPGAEQEVAFVVSPAVGEHKVRIGNSSEASLLVQDSEEVVIAKRPLYEYCSAKAKPYEIEIDKQHNRFRIKASGSDFYHAEDSYAAVYLKGVKGDFVATVKIKRFGDRTHEWFRAGLFARNAMDKSFDAKPGSKGSFLVFGTPGRAGVNYDEFANGCMHKASSENLPENTRFPIWLKLERHGNHFVGSISLDGKNWIITRRSGDIPGLAGSIDLGLAAGAPDKQRYWVEFEDWQLKVAR